MSKYKSMSFNADGTVKLNHGLMQSARIAGVAAAGASVSTSLAVAELASGGQDIAEGLSNFATIFKNWSEKVKDEAVLEMEHEAMLKANERNDTLKQYNLKLDDDGKVVPIN